MPAYKFDVVYWSSSNVIFRLVSCANYCAQRNRQDDMEAGIHRSMRAFIISKAFCAKIVAFLQMCTVQDTLVNTVCYSLAFSTTQT